jgi:hypothetical protein
MTLDLTEEETGALASLLSRTIDDDRYPLSPRIQILKGILAKIRPEPPREPLPPPKQLRTAARDYGKTTARWALTLESGPAQATAIASAMIAPALVTGEPSAKRSKRTGL